MDTSLKSIKTRVSLKYMIISILMAMIMIANILIAAIAQMNIINRKLLCRKESLKTRNIAMIIAMITVTIMTTNMIMKLME